LQQSEKKLSAKNLNYYQEKFLSLKKQRAEWKELMAETPVSISHYLESDFNLKRISTAFSPNQLLIRYCLLENDIIAFYLTDQTIDALLLSEHPKVLQKKIQHLSEPLLDFSCGQVDYLQINFDLYTAQELYQILLEPILEKFPEKKELFIVADKELKIIPFDALVMSFKDTDMFSDEIIFSEYGQANYVADQYLIQYMLTLFHADQRNTPFKKKYFSIAAFGLPLINQSDLILQSLLAENPCLNPKPLPATRTEIDKIRAVYGNQPMYSALESDFTKENFFAYAPQANIVHIATHFIFNKSFPLQSAFIFSPGNDQQMFFYMKDFLKMKAALECLVLSACETSRGLLQDDQRLSSIASTWHFSGIKRVIASFWPIDEFTAELMPLFYEKLKQTNNYSIALNQAKLIFKNKVITIDKSHKISFAHPFLWANYGLFKLY
jgi:CHAT domain-containing protein